MAAAVARARRRARSRTSCGPSTARGDFFYPFSVQQKSTSRGGWIDPFRAVWRAGARMRRRVTTSAPASTSSPRSLLVVLIVVLWRRWPASFTAYAIAAAFIGLSARNLDSLERYSFSTVPFVRRRGRPHRRRDARAHRADGARRAARRRLGARVLRGAGAVSTPGGRSPHESRFARILLVIVRRRVRRAGQLRRDREARSVPDQGRRARSSARTRASARSATRSSTTRRPTRIAAGHGFTEPLWSVTHPGQKRAARGRPSAADRHGARGRQLVGRAPAAVGGRGRQVRLQRARRPLRDGAVRHHPRAARRPARAAGRARGAGPRTPTRSGSIAAGHRRALAEHLGERRAGHVGDADRRRGGRCVACSRSRCGTTRPCWWAVALGACCGVVALGRAELVLFVPLLGIVVALTTRASWADRTAFAFAVVLAGVVGGRAVGRLQRAPLRGPDVRVDQRRHRARRLELRQRVLRQRDRAHRDHRSGRVHRLPAAARRPVAGRERLPQARVHVHARSPAPAAGRRRARASGGRGASTGRSTW